MKKNSVITKYIGLLILMLIMCSMASCDHTHEFGEWTITKSATCTENGLEERYCNCGEHESRQIPASGHSFDEWSIDISATCTNEGVEKRYCGCGASESRPLSATGHNFGTWKVDVAATCTNEGVEKRYCDCGESESRPISATGHNFGAWKVDVTATCTKEGIEVRICNCGEKESRATDKTSHKYGNWTVVKKATCTIDGTEEQTCTCGKKQTRTIKAGHTWEDATCTSPKKCTVCGETTGEALGHTTDDGTCSRCGKKVVNDQSLVVDGAYSALKSWLVPYLKNPSSLTINSVTYSKYESNTTPGEYLYVMFINYSAMNGFGGYNRESVMYYCDSQKIYKSKDTSDYTIIDVGSLSSGNIALLNSAL